MDGRKRFQAQLNNSDNYSLGSSPASTPPADKGHTEFFSEHDFDKYTETNDLYTAAIQMRYVS